MRFSNYINVNSDSYYDNNLGDSVVVNILDKKITFYVGMIIYSYQFYNRPIRKLKAKGIITAVSNKFKAIWIRWDITPNTELDIFYSFNELEYVIGSGKWGLTITNGLDKASTLVTL